jgi:restriction system protein
VIAAADRETFTAFDLSAVNPASTLEHLGASLSKNPFGLTPAQVKGVRRS